MCLDIYSWQLLARLSRRCCRIRIWNDKPRIAQNSSRGHFHGYACSSAQCTTMVLLRPCDSRSVCICEAFHWLCDRCFAAIDNRDNVPATTLLLIFCGHRWVISDSRKFLVFSEEILRFGSKHQKSRHFWPNDAVFPKTCFVTHCNES